MVQSIDELARRADFREISEGQEILGTRNIRDYIKSLHTVYFLFERKKEKPIPTLWILTFCDSYDYRTARMYKFRQDDVLFYIINFFEIDFDVLVPVMQGYKAVKFLRRYSRILGNG